MGIKEMESTEFAGIGRELLESGRGKVSEYGILFLNEEMKKSLRMKGYLQSMNGQM